MRNRMYGGVSGRKTKVGEKPLCFPPARFCMNTDFTRLWVNNQCVDWKRIQLYRVFLLKADSKNSHRLFNVG